MDNNDIFRRLRYIFDYNDAQMIEIFQKADFDVSRARLSDWLKKDYDENMREMGDYQLAIFLTGLINTFRGKREGPQPPVERELNNNIIFRKLRIALSLKDTDILALFKSVNMPIGKHELSAFFRRPTQSQYRECQDQYLRNFLHGLQIKYRGKNTEEE